MMTLGKDLLHISMTDVLSIWVIDWWKSHLASAVDHYGREKSTGIWVLQARYDPCHKASAGTSHIILLNQLYTRKDICPEGGKLEIFDK